MSKIASNVWKYFLIFVGFVFCQNILSFFKIGNTNFNILFAFLIIAFLVLILINRKNIFGKLSRIPFLYLMFLFSSILSTGIAFINLNMYSSVLPAFKGLVYYGASSLVPLLCGLFFSKNDKEAVFLGILIGYICNIVFSIFGFITFNFLGLSLTLNKTIKLSSFFSPDYYYSAQGFFLEPSHFAGFLLPMFYLLFWHFKKKKIRIAIFLLTWLAFVLYSRGNTIFFVLSQIAFFLIMYRNKISQFFKERILSSKKAFSIFAILCLFLIISVVAILKGPLNSKFMKLINEANPFSSANAERFKMFKVGLEIMAKYPFGVGYNMTGNAIMHLYPDFKGTPSTYSMIVTIFIEQGLFGGITFLAFLLLLIRQTFMKVKKGYILGLGLICGFIFSFLNGPNESYLYLLTGVAIAECNIKPFFLIKPNERGNKNSFFIEI